MCVYLKKFRLWFLLVAFGILFYSAINHIGDILSVLGKICNIFSPILGGLLLAFVANAPVRWINKELHQMKFPKPWSEHKMHVASILLTLILIALICIVIVLLIVPNLISSVSSIYSSLMDDLPKLFVWLEEHGIDTTEIKSMLFTFDASKLIGANGLISGISGFASQILGTFMKFSISMVLAIYMLFDKHHLKKWAIKILYAFFPKQADSVYDFYEKLEKSYFDFFTGQVLESCILGTIMFFALSIAGIPYSVLIAVLTAIFAVIPYLGAWFACGVGVIFIVFDNPPLALLCIIVYASVQFIENQFIYPHVVGNKVGLSPLLTLGSVIVGGSLFGILGMILFIPFVVVLRDMMVEYINKKDIENGYDENTDLKLRS